MELVSDGIRVSFSEESVNLFVIKDNDEEGVEHSLNKMEGLHQHLFDLRIDHEVMDRKYGSKRKIDQIRIKIRRK